MIGQKVAASPVSTASIGVFDVVALLEAGGEDLPAGREGTVVDILADGALLVEFADSFGVMQHLVGMKPAEVRLVWSAAENGA